MCSINGCEKPVKSRKFCSTHYARWVKYGDPLMTVTTSPSDSAEDRLVRYTDRQGPDECWEWSGYRDRDGYGSVRFQGGRVKAHALAYKVANKCVIDAGLVVRHQCDNPPCVNPAHLILGTPADNSQDMVARGRTVRRFGEANPTAKLTTAAVAQIRVQLASGESHNSIARRHGVSRKAISKIANRVTWKEAS